MAKAKEDGIGISVENLMKVSNYLSSLCEEFDRRFQDLKKVKNMLWLINNPWHLQLPIISEIGCVFGCNYTELLK